MRIDQLGSPISPQVAAPYPPNSSARSTPAEPSSPSPAAAGASDLASAASALTLDERTAKAAEADPEFAAALQRAREKELEQAKLMCSIENKEACLMCSG